MDLTFRVSLGSLLKIFAPWNANAFLPDSVLTLGKIKDDLFPRVSILCEIFKKCYGR